MATKKPRINVTLEPREYELFKRYAEIQGVSMSKVISGFMALTIQPVERLCVILESIKIANSEVTNGFKNSVYKSEKDLSAFFQKHTTEHDLFFSTIDSEYDRDSPLAVTTGDRYPNTTQKTGFKGSK